MRATALLAVGVLALVAPASASAQQDPAGEASAKASGRVSSEAAFLFTLAKLQVEEGDYRAALDTFEEVLALDPDAAYARIEYAQFLARLGRFGRTRGARLEQLGEAVRQAEEALRLDPGNPDGLQALADANLALASEEPADPEPQAAAIRALEELRSAGRAELRSLIALGQIYLRRDQHAEAARVFQEVVGQAPSYEPVYRLLAEALINAGRLDAASEALERVIAFEPAAESARVALAEILIERGEHRRAVEVLREAPGGLESPEGRQRLAVELYVVGELDASLAELEELLADDPDNRYLNLVRGLVLSAQAKNAEALAALEPLLGGGPGSGDLAVTVSELLVREGRSDEAVETLRETLRRLEGEGSEEAASARLALARLYADLDDWNAAGAALEPLLDGATPLAERLGAELLEIDVLVELGRVEQAFARLDRLASEAGGASDAASGAAVAVEAKRAEVLARAGRTEEAEVLLAEASDAPVGELLAVVEGLQRSELFAPTIPVLENVLERSPESTVARLLLGAAQERTGAHEAAVATFRALLEQVPDFHPALNYLGYMWIERGENLAEAVPLVERAVELEPGNGAYLDSLGWGYYQQGRFEEARHELERAARLEQDATIFEHLGDVYAALGRGEQARRAYRRALELEADDEATLVEKLDRLGVEGN